MRDIQNVNSLIYKKNQNVDAYKEAIENVEKLHSQASKPVQEVLRNKYLSVSQPASPKNAEGKFSYEAFIKQYTLRKRLDTQDKDQIKKEHL